jgi:glycosyltransferase involved in cell wall biosynthesis
LSDIALFTRDLAAGGVGRVILNLVRGFIDRGRSVDLVLVRAEGPYLAQLPAGVRLVELGARRTLTSLPRLVRYLRQARPRSLLSCTDGANVVALWAQRFAGGRTGIVISTHTAMSHDALASPHLRRRVLPSIVKYVYGWADATVAVSAGVADDLARTARLARERIHVIHNPVDLEMLTARAREKPDHPWFDAGAPPVIVSAGRLTAQKDFPTLLRAYARVRRVHRARLMILGEGEERAALEGLARELDCAEDFALPGFIPNPYPYMTGAALFALSSAWEGFGNVLIEALALGTPVVATDCPFGPSEILEGGRLGRLVPVGDVEALADAIAASLAAPPPAEPGVRRAHDFDLLATADRYLALMDTAGPPPPS